jgi:hypothetical protein
MNDDFRKEENSVLRRMILLYILMIFTIFGSIGAMIWFIFWICREYGII